MNTIIEANELMLSISDNSVATTKNIAFAKEEIETKIDSINDIVLFMDEDGTILSSNRAVFLWNLQDVKKPKGLMFHDLFHHNCKNSKCHFEKYWEQAKQNIYKNQSFEYQHFDEILNKFLQIQFRPLAFFQERQHVKIKNFTLVIIKDITKQKTIEIELLKKDVEIETIFKVLPDQYIRLDSIGNVLDVKFSSNLNSLYFPQIIYGQKIYCNFSDAIKRKFEKAIDDVANYKSIIVFEYSLSKNLEKLFFEARLIPFIDNQIIVINRNISEKHMLESIAESVNMTKNLGYIFSGIRHEIGNPINAIKMTMSVLKKNIDNFGKDKIMVYTDRVLENINRVEYLLKSFKNFNMFENMKSENINIVTFFKDLFSLINEDLHSKGIKAKLDIKIKNAIIYADKRALHQVLLNIISNAADALDGRDNPQITFSVKNLDKNVFVIISDNGIGISEKSRKNLFKPFFTTKENGTGLGLVIIKKILTEMNANININSTNNKGTSVVLIFPKDKRNNN